MSIPAPTFRRSTSNVFGSEAPHDDLRLPQDLPILAVEIITYLPNALRNDAAVLRFVQAGLDQKTLANIVNLHRILPTKKFPILPNSVCKVIENGMRRNSGRRDWTVTKHKKGEFTYNKTWDADDISLNGVRLNCEVSGKGLKPIEGFPFAELAHKVNIHPSYRRGDGFMLTRCVQYAAAHPGKGYVFPRDFAYLVEKLDDGRQLHPCHFDAASLSRWKRKTAWMIGERPEIENFDNVEDSDDESDDVSMDVDEAEDGMEIDNHFNPPDNSVKDREISLSGASDLFVPEDHHDQTSFDQLVAMEDVAAPITQDIDPFSLSDEQFLRQYRIPLDQFDIGISSTPQDPLLLSSTFEQPPSPNDNSFYLSNGHPGYLDPWQYTIPLDRPSPAGFLQTQDPSFPSISFGEVPLQRRRVLLVPNSTLRPEDSNEFAPYDWRAPCEISRVHRAANGVVITSPPPSVPLPPPQLLQPAQAHHYWADAPLHFDPNKLFNL
jgi:hypothetical protein